MSNPTHTVRDIVDSILKRGMSYAYALGTTESMLKDLLARFTTPEQQQAWIDEQMKREAELSKPV